MYLLYFFTDDVHQTGLGAFLLGEWTIPVVTLLFVGTAFSKNDDYLSFHGTFMAAIFLQFTISDFSGG